MGTGDDNGSSLLGDLTGLQGARSTAVFLEVAFDAVVTFDDQEKITSWNPAAEKMFGWTAQEAMGKTPGELFWPVDVPLENEYKSQRQTRLKRGETLQGEAIPCRKDGSSFPAQFIARATFDSEGKISGYMAIYRDLSTKVQAREKEEQLRQSNQRLNQILASIQDDFYVLNHDWIFVFASRTFTARIGKEPEDFVGNNIWEMFPNHVGGTLYENFHIAMEERQVRRFEIPGKYTNAWYRMTAFPSEEGITVIGTDITEVKKTENALRTSEQRLQRVLETDAVGVLFFDPDGYLIQANDVFLNMTGYTRQQIEQRELTWQKMTPPEWLEESEAQMDLFAQTGRIGPYEKEYFLADGSRLWMLFAGRAVGDGTISEFCIDISDRKRVEEALLENEKQLQQLNESLEQKVQEKTAEVRRLAADLVIAVQRERHRISHILHDDLQQRIYAIQMQLTFLHNELDKVSLAAQREALDIGEQLEKVLEITRHLSVDLSPPILRDEGLTQAISWLAGQMKQRYGLPIEIQADGSFIVSDEEMQVLLFNCVRELLFNVVKHAEASRAVVSLQWLEGSLRIEVCDDGKGFPVQMEDQRATEEMSEEENLQLSFGLPTLRHQLNLFDGQMEIRSEPGVGTQVVLVIPVANSP